MPGRYQAVASILLIEDGNVLMVQEGKDHIHGVWNLPAGKVEPDETPQEAAVREASEEAGITVEPTGIVGIYLGTSDSSDATVINFVHTAERIDGTPHAPADDSVLAVEWVSRDTVPERDLRAPYIRAALEDLQENGASPLGAVRDVRAG